MNKYIITLHKRIKNLQKQITIINLLIIILFVWNITLTTHNKPVIIQSNEQIEMKNLPNIPELPDVIGF